MKRILTLACVSFFILLFFTIPVMAICEGDFDCDGDVDGGDVEKFLEDFGRSTYINPCPLCDGSAWCTYP